MDQHRPILLTSPDGTNSIINNVATLSIEDSNNTHLTDDPPSPKSADPHYFDNNNNHPSSMGVQFDAEQLQRGRSRIKRRSDNMSKGNDTANSNGNLLGATLTNNNNNSSGNHPNHFRSRSGSRSFSRSRSRSRSRTASRIRDEEFLKWTVLRQDPSMRLHNYKVKYSHNGNKNRSNIRNENDKNNRTEDEDEDTDDKEFDDDSDDTEEDDEEEDEDDDDEEDEDDYDEDDEDDDDEESDEEQVSDIENDNSINEQFNYDLGTKVLPNFCISINDVLESSKPWIDKYESEHPNDTTNDSNINICSLEGGYIRGVLPLNKRGPLTSNENADNNTTTTTNTNTNELIETTNNDSYILYVDLTSESIYAITYVMGTLVKNGDTLYIVHWHSDSKDDFVKKDDIIKNIIKLRNHVLHLFDCISATVDNLDVIILSLTHPYPKHLLNEMINGLQPLALCCSLSMTLSGLQNFVCSVPTFIIRKKLKRPKKKGIFD